MAACILSVAALSFTAAPICPRVPAAITTRHASPVAVVEVSPQIAAAAVTLAGGLAYAVSQQKSSSSPPPAPKAAAPASAPPSPAPKRAAAKKNTWGLNGVVRKVTISSHPSSNPAPVPKRELWTPPPGWTPPSKPVSSWYDRGDRLTPPAPPPFVGEKVESKKNFFEQLQEMFSGGSSSSSAAAAPSDWGLHSKARKVTISSHPKSNPAPVPKRELWTPPPGWTPPSKPAAATVASWYDSGQRL